MNLPTKLIFCCMFLSCFTYGQGRDSLNSRVSISFSSGVARSYVSYKMNFKDDYYVGTYSPYYKVGLEERLNKYFSLHQSYTHQTFDFENKLETTERVYFYGGYGRTLTLHGKYKFFFTKSTFDFLLKTTPISFKKFELSFLLGPQFSIYNAKYTLIQYTGEINIPEFSKSGYEPSWDYQYWHDGFDNYTYSLSLNAGLMLRYNILKRLAINLECGLNSQKLTTKRVLISNQFYSTYVGIGITKKFKYNTPKTLKDSSIKKNSFYLEVFGNGLLASLNYERKLRFKPRPLFFHAGTFFASKNIYVISSGIYMLNKSQTNKRTELGFNITYSSLNGNKEKTYMINLSLGRRFYFSNSTMFRFFASLNPIYNYDPPQHKFFIYPFLGLSFGGCY